MGTSTASSARGAIQVGNVTRDQTLVAEGWVADSYWSRLRGLIGRSPLAPGQGLLIVPCNSVHTQFMRFAIDVLYIDQDLRVVAVDCDMKPWRIGRIHRRARAVLEVPAGTVIATGTVVGDVLAVEGYSL